MIKEGAKAPAFTLLSDAGEKVSLKDFKGKNVILYFYPKDNTPGCTLESCDFRDSFSKFKKFNAVILGISKDSVESHLKFKTKFKFPFPLLSDPDGKVCELFEVWQEKMLYGRKFMGIVRTTFLIGPDGKIQKIFPKVKVTGHVDALLHALSAL